MKKFTLLTYAFAFVLFASCEVDKVDQESNLLAKDGADALSLMAPISSNLVIEPSELGESCVTVNLMAGQHHVAGDVSVYNDGENLIVIFTSNGDWALGTTHLSIGNCDEDWIPLTGSGNPKIGRFAFTDPYSATADEVVYVIPLEGLGDNYCFAAHAEVQGPTGGETAWAEGAQLGGRSWAMFVESNLSDCPDNDGDNDGDGDGDGGDDDGGGMIPT